MKNEKENQRQCPRCSYIRNETDTAPDYECPKCGVIFKKYLRKIEKHWEKVQKAVMDNQYDKAIVYLVEIKKTYPKLSKKCNDQVHTLEQKKKELKAANGQHLLKELIKEFHTNKRNNTYKTYNTYKLRQKFEKLALEYSEYPEIFDECFHYGHKIEQITEIKKDTSISKLIKCSVCEKKISINANSCPFCGEPNSKDRATTNLKQILGIAGASILFIGVFLPIVRIPILGSMNYFQNGKGDGIIIIILAILSIYFALSKKLQKLWFTGLGSLAVLVFTFINFQTKLSNAKYQMNVSVL